MLARGPARQRSWIGIDAGLTWVGLAAVVVTAVLASRIYSAFGVAWSIIAVVVLGVFALVLGQLRDRAFTSKFARAVAPVLALAAVDAFVYWVTGLRLHASAAAFFRALLAPACFVGAAALGYVVSRRDDLVPLAGAAAAAWICALSAALELGQRLGLSTPLGRAYAAWSTAIGAWQPGAGEGFRAVGLEVDPNTLGLIGVVCLLVAAALETRPRLRAFTAVGATLVIVASGSRTALAAIVLAGGVTAVLAFMKPADGRARLRALVPVALAVAATLAVIGLALAATGGPAVVLHRFETSASALGQANSSAADEALSGRLQIWSNAFAAYVAHPLGAFQPTESLLAGRSVHNEYIDRLLYGGPLMLAPFLLLLGWLFVRVRPDQAPSLGPALAIAWAASAAMLGPTLSPPFIAMAFYLIGWAVSRDAQAVVPRVKPSRKGRRR